MFFSLIQTLVCVLLINGGLYALHLTGNGNSGASSGTGGGGVEALSGQIGPSSQSANDMINLLTGGGHHHAQHAGGGVGGGGGSLKKQKPLDSSGRLTEELADMAQLERERLMLLGLAKQTAAAGTGHHGRPIITGRIQMTPAEDIEGDYPALLMQQARGFLFGNVVKQPTETDDYEAAEDYDGGSLNDGRRPVKYEYGRVVQPSDREYAPQHMDVDEFLELESEPDVEDMLPDLDGYQYLDEILAEQHRGLSDDPAMSNFGSHHGYHAQGHTQNAFQTLEELEAHPQQMLQGLFGKERYEDAANLQQEQEQQQTATAGKHRNGAYNIHLQQKWQRKRTQQQLQQQQLKQWQRNIFGRQKQPHHNGAQHTKLSMANSEATATKHIDKSSSSDATSPAVKAAMQSSSSLLSAPALGAAALATQNGRSAQQSDRQAAQVADKAKSTSVDAAPPATKTAAKFNAQQQQQTPEKFLHPNRKRSDGVTATASGGYSAGMQSPVTHSIASQLMLRTARGQRQYDVPQIGEYLFKYLFCRRPEVGVRQFLCRND